MSDLKTYTWLEVTEHMTEESCWLVIDGKVFDVTKYLDDHPGSRKPLLKYAGQDASAAWVRVGHSENAAKIRDTMIVGKIEENEPSKEYWFKVRTARWEFFTYTKEEVAQHDKTGDQWIIIGDHVYDFSSLEHPGGQAVIDKYAGKDGTAVFNKIEKHTPGPMEYKEKFRIGKLKVPETPAKQDKKVPNLCYLATAGIVVGAVALIAYKKLRN